MSDIAADFEDPLYQSVLLRRVAAWMLDVCLLGILVWIVWLLVLMLGVLTFGLGFVLLGTLPVFGFCYHALFVAGPWSATPGEMVLDLVVRRDADFGPPSVLQALVFTAGLWLTLSIGFILLLAAPFTERKRALHDIAAGVVIVRNRALTVRLASLNMGAR